MENLRKKYPLASIGKGLLIFSVLDFVLLTLSVFLQGFIFSLPTPVTTVIMTGLLYIGYLMWPALVLGLILLAVGGKFVKHDTQSVATGPVITRGKLLLWNSIAAAVTVVFGFLFFMGAVMMGDSGSNEGAFWTQTFTIINVVYIVSSFVSIIYSQIKRSLLLTQWPIFFPFAQMGLMMLLGAIGSLFGF